MMTRKDLLEGVKHLIDAKGYAGDCPCRKNTCRESDCRFYSNDTKNVYSCVIFAEVERKLSLPNKSLKFPEDAYKHLLNLYVTELIEGE